MKKLLDQVPPPVREALRELEERGHSAYIVGGAVRDMLLGITPKDFDIATSARPNEIIKIFQEKRWIVVPKGIKYGVVLVIEPETRTEIEIATFRREVYPLDYARRNVKIEFTNRIEEDLSRRDFTINALALSPTGEILDLFGGLEDLKTGKVRFVGEPGERIREDPLRMLRAVRFAVKLGFQIAEDALRAIRDLADKILHVSRERIGEEITKALTGREPWRLPRLLQETGLLRHIFPELSERENTEKAERTLRRLILLTTDLVTLLAGLLSPLIEEVEKTVKIIRDIVSERLRLPRRDTEKIVELVRTTNLALHSGENDMERLAARLLSRYPETAEQAALLAYSMTGRADYLHLLERIRELRRRQIPNISGKDLIEILKLKPGPEVREVLERAREIAYLEGLTSKERLIKRIRELYREKLMA